MEEAGLEAADLVVVGGELGWEVVALVVLDDELGQVVADALVVGHGYGLGQEVAWCFASNPKWRL